MRACAVCFFYVGQTGPDGVGDCHLSPPQVFMVTPPGQGEATFMSVRPQVASQEFCDRFSHKLSPPRPSHCAGWQAPKEVVEFIRMWSGGAAGVVASDA
jgi:hypothetical protein